VHYLKMKGVEPTTPPNAAALLNFQVGFLWEDIWDKALKWKGVEYKAQEKFIEPKYNVGGTCDFLVKTGEDTWEIWDSKTQGSKWFWYVQGQINKGEYDEFKEEFQYIVQQGVYIWLARKAGYNVTCAKLAYISKDDGFVGKVTTVVLDEKLEKIILDRINYMNDCLENEILPKCECEGWKIGYCNYGDPLTRTYNRTKKLVNTECCPPTPEKLEIWRNG
jgi:CRISPR/Cas system-associated exonuclease Cas4 (RecB family)